MYINNVKRFLKLVVKVAGLAKTSSGPDPDCIYQDI